jgi:flavodoxin
MGNSILVAFFSRPGNNYVNGRIINLSVGNTEIAAKKIQGLTGGELFKINPVHPYAYDYNTCTNEAKRELRNNVRPELAENLHSMEGFDTIILGYPNWWGSMPMPVWTFLESHNFSGKTILPLCTHEGSGMGNSERDIKKLCPDAKLVMGLAIHGGSVKNADHEIEAWLKANRLI